MTAQLCVCLCDGNERKYSSTHRNETKQKWYDQVYTEREVEREKETAGTELCLLKVLCTHSTQRQSQSLGTFKTVNKTNIVVCCVCMGNNTNCPRRRRATKKRTDWARESRKRNTKKSNNNFCVDIFFVSFVCIVTELSCKLK